MCLNRQMWVIVSSVALSVDSRAQASAAVQHNNINIPYVEMKKVLNNLCMYHVERISRDC